MSTKGWVVAMHQGISTIISGKATINTCNVLINDELIAPPLSLTNIMKEQKDTHDLYPSDHEND